MKVDRPLRIPVFLSRSTLRDRLGIEVSIRERRLVRQSDADRVIAVVEAPAGSRIRTRPDQHGADQLLVPVGRSAWSRLFGSRVAIPAKYLINEARSRAHGLALSQYLPEEVTA